jgi:O-antigen/teichoic acid export membrane protein
MRKNFFYNITFSIANILFPIISFPYASRILGPAGIGKVQMAFSLAQYFSLIAALGVPVYGIQKIAKVKLDRTKLYITLSELFILNSIASLLISGIYLCMILALPFFATSTAFYLIAGLMIVFGAMNIDWFYSGLENFRMITLRSVCIKLMALFALYGFVKKESDYVYYLLITLFAYLGNCVWGFVPYVKKINFKWEDLDFKQHIKPLVYILCTMIVASVYTMLDTVFLGFFSCDTAVGFYTAATKLTRIVIPVITAFGTVLIPSFAKSFEQKNDSKIQELIDTSFNIIISLAVPACIGLFLLSNEFILVFSGEKFSQASVTMKILSVLPLIVGIGHLFVFQLMAPAERNKEMFWSAIIGTIVFVVLNLILVPAFSEKGEAVVAVVTEIIVSISYYYFLRKTVLFKLNKKLIVEALISAVFFVPFIMWIQSFHLEAWLTLIESVSVCIVWYIGIQIWVFKNVFLTEQYIHIRNKFF